MNVSQGIIEQFAIKRGAILHSTMFDDIDHGKFFVVIGVSESSIAGFFFINSRIHHSILGKQAQLDMQYLLRKSDYTFLHYDSFLCATKIIKRSVTAMADSIESVNTIIIDQLKPAHLQEILEMVRSSKLFSKREKETFFV